MCRLIQFIIITTALMFLAPAQASLNFDSDPSICKVLNANASADGKKIATDNEKDEEEPDCD